MKSGMGGNANKSLGISFMICVFMVSSAQAQRTVLTLKNGSATVKKIMQPRRESDAHVYFLNLRKGRTVAIKVDAKGLFLSKENECSVFFDLYDDKGELVFIGDDMVGIDTWKGEVEKTGNYQIKVAFKCIEGFTTNDL
ncbi:MAG TPA: hypothetical protein VF719_10645, partial [Abditibacteriaceae bacterium]